MRAYLSVLSPLTYRQHVSILCNISIVLAVALLILPASPAKSALGSPMAQTGDRGIGMNDPYRSELFRVRGVPSITIHTLAGEIEVIRNPELQGEIGRAHV